MSVSYYVVYGSLVKDIIDKYPRGVYGGKTGSVNGAEIADFLRGVDFAEGFFVGADIPNNYSTSNPSLVLSFSNANYEKVRAELNRFTEEANGGMGLYGTISIVGSMTPEPVAVNKSGAGTSGRPSNVPVIPPNDTAPGGGGYGKPVAALLVLGALYLIGKR